MLRIFNKCVKFKYNHLNDTQKKINLLLLRKDIINLENDKIDAIRLLSCYLEGNKIKLSELVKFLKK